MKETKGGREMLKNVTNHVKYRYSSLERVSLHRIQALILDKITVVTSTVSITYVIFIASTTNTIVGICKLFRSIFFLPWFEGAYYFYTNRFFFLIRYLLLYQINFIFTSFQHTNWIYTHKITFFLFFFLFMLAPFLPKVK